MARRTAISRFAVCLSCACVLLAALAAASFHDDEFSDAAFLNIGSGLACELAKCLKGQCINSTSFPFYKCECNAGWQSPFGASWLPCILPNCSIDLTCANKSAAAPAPSVAIPSFSGGLDVCSLHVCGNGECIRNNSSSRNATDDDYYECMCDPGFVNFGNKTDGYCIRKCSIGADCTNVKLPFGGGHTSSPPPPAVASPASSSSASVNQGLIMVAATRLVSVVTLALLIM